MNLAQIAKKSRLGVDAILPGGTVSGQWGDEEMVDLITSAYEEVWRRYRLARKKWGLLTLKQSDAAFTRDGETYTPTTALQITSSSNRITLPPDFGELTRILCLDDRSVRFIPADMEGYHFIDSEQGGYDDLNSVLTSAMGGLNLYYDIIAARTLIFTPPVATSLNLQLDYVPLKRPLYYTAAGTISQTGTALTGTGTTWVTDGLVTEDTGNAAELITLPGAFTTLGAATVRLDRDYPRVAALTADTTATMVASATIAGGTNYIMAMAPALPRDVHRWLAEYVSALMLKKINPELAEKYGADLLTRFDESVRPTAGRRQGQESPVTEDAEEFGASGTV